MTTRGVPMLPLSPGQETQLGEIMNVLERLATPALIYESMRLRAPEPPLGPNDRKRLYRAYGGVVAAVKIQSYLESMRQANLRRVRVGDTIERLNEEVHERRATDPMSVVAPAVEIPLLSGLQEIEVHTFVIAVNALYTLLPIAARAAGYKIQPAALRTMRPYVDLRDYYEHLDQRLPGAAHKHALQAFTVIEDEESLRMAFGLPVDPETGEFILDGQRVDVSSRAVHHVQTIARDVWQGIKQSAVADMDKFYRENPDRMPDPRAVDTDFEVRVGGRMQQVPLLHEHEGESFEKVGRLYVPTRLPVHDFSRPKHEN